MPPKATIPRTCETCGKHFMAQPWQVNAGMGRYCSMQCVGISQRGPNYKPQPPRKNRKSRATLAPFPERFWKRVNMDGDGCWEWTGGRMATGYGSCSYNGRAETTHRISWELTYGGIPEGLHVLHRCDNRVCVRPDHLFLGTHQDNMRDMVAKGRNHHPYCSPDNPSHNRGSGHGLSKLTESDVQEIRRLYETGKWLQRELAEMFGVQRGTISGIVRRRGWKHVA